MKPRIPRADLFVRIRFDLDTEVRQYCSRAGLTLQAFTEAALEKHLKHLRRRERGRVVDIAPELQKRQE